MRLSILGKDSKAKDDKPLEVVDTYMIENTAELVDPLDVQKKVGEIQEKRAKLLSELDTQIKVSNATTFIEIQLFCLQHENSNPGFPGSRVMLPFKSIGMS